MEFAYGSPDQPAVHSRWGEGGVGCEAGARVTVLAWGPRVCRERAAVAAGGLVAAFLGVVEGPPTRREKAGGQARMERSERRADQKPVRRGWGRSQRQVRRVTAGPHLSVVHIRVSDCPCRLGALLSPRAGVTSRPLPCAWGTSEGLPHLTQVCWCRWEGASCAPEPAPAGWPASEPRPAWRSRSGRFDGRGAHGRLQEAEVPRPPPSLGVTSQCPSLPSPSSRGSPCNEACARVR